MLPSQSLHALHFLKVAGRLLPQPNRYEQFYRANLFEGKALLRTAAQWHQMDEDAITAVFGQTEADTRRTSSSHLSFLALHDLILLEKDSLVRFQYQKLFLQCLLPMADESSPRRLAGQSACSVFLRQEYAHPLMPRCLLPP